jgi:EAL domain-containing protein (putative c-di-GMP-specific phosphodiesterase class I)
MEQACIEASKRKSLAESPVQVAVNISTIQLMNKNFAPKAAEILKRTGLKPAFSSVS